MFTALQKATRSMFDRVEAGYSYIFDDDWNPFHHLGALAFFFFWIVGATGLYLFIFFETSIFGAYSSIEALTHDQWYLGGVMRSLHRYCSDAMAVTVTLHLIREFSLGRYTGVRWFSWVSGVPLLWVMFAAAIGGYWLVWDQFAQYVAVVTSEWLDWLPNFSDPMARNFLTNESVSDRFFSLLVFLHIGIPLFMMLAMFVHISRITKAKSNPPRGLAIGTLSAFIVLSLIKPAVSAQPADLSRTQLDIPMDWFYLNFYPLIDIWGAGYVWMLLVVITLGLCVMPLAVRAKKEAVAVVDPDHCNGCGWCDQDCPYDAIDFAPHPNGKSERLAVVNADKCTSCGICSGSCPTATPFQHVDELKSGIGIPSFTIDDLKQSTLKILSELKGEGRIVVFGCDHGADVEQINKDNVARISFPCIGFLPPSFVDYILRKDKADGVLVTGCCSENCYFRSGNEWVEERFEGERYPHLRTKAAKNGNNVHIRWAGPMERPALEKEINAFRKSLIEGKGAESIIPIKNIRKGKRYYGQAAVYAVFVFLIGFFSTEPSYTRVPDGQATVKLSLRHTGQIIGECTMMSDEELQRLPPNMRQAKVCPRERSSIEVQFLMDGEEVYHQVVEPAGINKDGRAKLYHRFLIEAGEHEIITRLKDHRDLDDYNYQETTKVNLVSGGILVVDFDPDTKKFIIIGSSESEESTEVTNSTRTSVSTDE